MFTKTMMQNKDDSLDKVFAQSLHSLKNIKNKFH